MAGRSYLGGLDCLETVWLVKVGGLREFSMVCMKIWRAGEWLLPHRSAQEIREVLFRGVRLFGDSLVSKSRGAARV